MVNANVDDNGISLNIFIIVTVNIHNKIRFELKRCALDITCHVSACFNIPINFCLLHN